MEVVSEVEWPVAKLSGIFTQNSRKAILGQQMGWAIAHCSHFCTVQCCGAPSSCSCKITNHMRTTFSHGNWWLCNRVITTAISRVLSQHSKHLLRVWPTPNGVDHKQWIHAMEKWLTGRQQKKGWEPNFRIWGEGPDKTKIVFPRVTIKGADQFCLQLNSQTHYTLLHKTKLC